MAARIPHSICTMDKIKLRIETITDASRFFGFRSQWNELLSTRESKSLPLTHEWVSAWWKNFGGKRKLHISCVYDDNRLIAIAPFMKEHTTYRGVPITMLSLMANGHTPYCDVIFDGAVKEQIISDILELLVNANTENIIVFTKLPETSPTYTCLVANPLAYGYRYGIKDNLVTPIIRMDNSWDEYYKSRSRKFRKSINNKMNRYTKAPDFTIDREVITSRKQSTLNEIIEVSKHSWKTRIKNDLGSNAPGREFFFGLVDAFGEDHVVQIWIMRKAGAPVAYEFHLIFDGVVYPLRADYHEGYKKYSPGSILEYTALKALFEEQKISAYDSCADNYWYLNNWTDEIRKQFDIEIFANSAKSFALYAMEYHAIRLIRIVRDKIIPKH